MCLQCSHIFLYELILRFYFLRLGDNIAHKRLTGLYILPEDWEMLVSASAIDTVSAMMS